jgi:nucleotide-binding universal stress UspA family protein
VSLARKYGSGLTVVHVIHDFFGIESWNLPVWNLKKGYQNLLKKSRQQLDAIIAKENNRGMKINVLIQEGEPTSVILTIIKKKKIDLVIMLAHEEGRLEHFLFGRSNEELIRKMPCTILLVKKEPGLAT